MLDCLGVGDVVQCGWASSGCSHEWKRIFVAVYLVSWGEGEGTVYTPGYFGTATPKPGVVYTFAHII